MWIGELVGEENKGEWKKLGAKRSEQLLRSSKKKAELMVVNGI
jgi:hypothetical protein